MANVDHRKPHAELPPSWRYVLKDYEPDSTFHIYNRGRNRQPIFTDDVDRAAFLDAFCCRLGPNMNADGRGRRVRSFADEVRLISYCLMPNHFHLVLHQSSTNGLTQLMHAAMTAYVRGFNHRHGRKGPLFTARFCAVKINSRRQLQKTIAYVHANPPCPLEDPWSSHQLFMANRAARDVHWCRAELGLKTFGSRAAYLEQLFDAINKRQKEISTPHQAAP
ncbi:MAG: transposase [Thermoleophilaceae bacterium]|nr:transposase [Thermoleophilaceae bacterium]